MGTPGMRGIHHAGITVPDVEEATRFFVDVMGCRLVHELAPMSSDDDYMAVQVGVHPRAVLAKIHLLRCGDGSNLELFEFQAPDQRTETPGNADIGSAHIAFQVDDVPAAIAYLSERGVEIMGEPQLVTSGPTTGVTWIYVRAPWGLQMELISQPLRPEGAGPAEGLWEPPSPG